MTKIVRAQYAQGNSGKTIAARLLPGTDLITGIEEICRANKIQFASILNCFGSFQHAGYFYLIPKPESNVGAGYGDLMTAEGPIEFLTGTGVVCQSDGDYETHLHGTMSDQEGKLFGGHMVKGENPVITADIILTEICDMKLYRKFDEETGAKQFYPVKNGETETTILEI